MVLSFIDAMIWGRTFIFFTRDWLIYFKTGQLIQFLSNCPILPTLDEKFNKSDFYIVFIEFITLVIDGI